MVTTLLASGIRRVRVVDNGSSDQTATAARGAGAELLDEPIAGYGRACWRGLQNLPVDIEWILFCDGDGSDDLAQLGHFFAAAQNADLVIGVRRPGAGEASVLTPAQRFGNVLATALIHWGWGYRYHDLGPFRLIRRSSLEGLQMRDRSWGWTLEMQVRAIEQKLRVVEIPVIAYPRRAGRSKISGSLVGSVRAGVIILLTVAKLFFRRRLC